VNKVALAIGVALTLAGCSGGTEAGSPPITRGSAQIEILATTVTPPVGGVLTPSGSGPVAPAPTAVSLPGGSSPDGGSGPGPGAGGAKPGTASTVAQSVAHPVASVPAGYTVVAHATVPRVVARAEPDVSARVVAEVANPIASGAGLVLQAVDGAATNGEWIKVLLPVEPNGTTGWVRLSDVKLSNNPYRIVIDRASFSLQVFNQGRLWVDTAIGVGTGSTPTPVGRFYLLELLAPPNPDGAYGPYAFGLSGFSEVLDGFAGTDTAIIGIHGTNDPAALGTNVSHGCIRVSNDVIRQLAANVPLGTPVTIT
jgi:lipoprotein-anchoring transpeptidase ErfK/SrfK